MTINNRLLFFSALIAFTVLMNSASLRAEDKPPPIDWREVTKSDLEAINRLVREVHPAAQKAVGDARFRNALRAAEKTAHHRLQAVNDEAAYRAILRGFSIALGDPHIRVEFFRPFSGYRWAGLTFRYADGDFMVSQFQIGMPSWLRGSRLVECDGQKALDIGRQRLGGFWGNWSLSAERAQIAPLLLLDDGNPYLVPPKSCSFFALTGKTERLDLNWQRAPMKQVAAEIELAKSRFGTANAGLKFVDDIAWIGVPALDETADATASMIVPEGYNIISSAAIVFDLRGNHGGNSEKGDMLVDLLFGPAKTIRRDGDPHWRATPFVVQSLVANADNAEKTYGKESLAAAGWREVATSVEADMQHGLAFSPAIKSIGKPRQVKKSKRSALARKTFVLTDSSCVSSCLLLVERLRALGVRQLGMETSASQRYMEVRAQQLPSGFGNFTVLQKVDFGMPLWLGPFRPDFVVPAGASSREHFEKWVTDIVKSNAESFHD